MTNYKMKFATNTELAEVRLNAFLPTGEKFASYSLTNNEIDWVEPTGDEVEHLYSDIVEYIDTCVPSVELEGLDEFLRSLDHYAKQHAKQSVKSWSCQKCGATTTDPTHALITWFHKDCEY